MSFCFFSFLLSIWALPATRYHFQSQQQRFGNKINKWMSEWNGYTVGWVCGASVANMPAEPWSVHVWANMSHGHTLTLSTPLTEATITPIMHLFNNDKLINSAPYKRNACSAALQIICWTWIIHIMNKPKQQRQKMYMWNCSILLLLIFYYSIAYESGDDVHTLLDGGPLRFHSSLSSLSLCCCWKMGSAKARMCNCNTHRIAWRHSQIAVDSHELQMIIALCWSCECHVLHSPVSERRQKKSNIIATVGLSPANSRIP